jgi:hypothetical protein
MISLITPLYGKQLLDRFKMVATTLTNEYIEDFYKLVQTSETTPTFEVLMQKVKLLQDDLTYRLTWIREDYKEERGKGSTRLTRGCKRIISESVHHYLNSAKTIMVCRSHFPAGKVESNGNYFG